MKFGMKELVRKNIGQFVLVFMMIVIITLCSVGCPYSLKYVVDDMLPRRIY